MVPTHLKNISQIGWIPQARLNKKEYTVVKVDGAAPLPKGGFSFRGHDQPRLMGVVSSIFSRWYTLQGTNISPKNGILKMIFLFPKWDMLVPYTH